MAQKMNWEVACTVWNNGSQKRVWGQSAWYRDESQDAQSLAAIAAWVGKNIKADDRPASGVCPPATHPPIAPSHAQ